MKKIVLASLITVTLFADIIIGFDDLPMVSKRFLKTHFKNVKINLIEKDLDGYEVKLNNGMEIEFDINGEIKEVDGKYNAIPDTILSDVLIKAKQNQKSAKLIEIEKKLNGYKLKFDNNIKVYINEKGDILGQKYDD